MVIRADLKPVNCKYGAPLGRPCTGNFDPDAGRINLQCIPLDRGGYDRGGVYWGIGQPLYWAYQYATDAQEFFRATNRGDAKRIFSDQHGDGFKFFR